MVSVVGGCGSHHDRRAATIDRVAVRSEVASTLPQQYQPPRRVGMAQKSPGRTNAVDFGSNGKPGCRDIAQGYRVSVGRGGVDNHPDQARPRAELSALAAWQRGATQERF